MTLIEILVSLAIFLILVGILGWNFDRSHRNQAIREAADQLASDLRLVQNMSMTGSTIEGAVPIGGYGMYFRNATTSYFIFADRERWINGTTDCEPIRNERYDIKGIDVTCLADGDNDDLLVYPESSLPKDVEIIAMRVDGAAENIVDLTFLPPKPLPYIATGDITGAARLGRTLEIDLRHNVTNSLRRITVIGASGQISVTTP